MTETSGNPRPYNLTPTSTLAKLLNPVALNANDAEENHGDGPARGAAEQMQTLNSRCAIRRSLGGRVPWGKLVGRVKPCKSYTAFNMYKPYTP